MTCRLCSIITTECPLSTSLRKQLSSFEISSKCRPVVGSSKIKSVLDADSASIYVASFTRCASPPESIELGCPSDTYPSPTSESTCSLFVTFLIPLKNKPGKASLKSLSLMMVPQIEVEKFLKITDKKIQKCRFS